MILNSDSKDICFFYNSNFYLLINKTISMKQEYKKNESSIILNLQNSLYIY